MELTKNNMDDVRSAFNSKLGDFYTQSPQEGNSKSMAPRIRRIWRPNNYRRQIKVKDKSVCIETAVMTAVDSDKEGYLTATATIGAGNKHIYIKGLLDGRVTLQYGKNKLTGMWNQERQGKEKKWFLLEGTLEEIKKNMGIQKQEIQEKIDVCMDKFIDDFRLRITNKRPTWESSETGYEGDNVLDNLPEDLIIHNKRFKKVYTDCFEFKTGKDEDPTAPLEKFITNRLIEDISPEIAHELTLSREITKNCLEVCAGTNKTLNNFVTSFLPIQMEHAVNISTHTKVLQEIAKSIKKFNTMLCSSQKKLSDFR